MATAAPTGGTVEDVESRPAPQLVRVTVVLTGRLSDRLLSAFPDLTLGRRPGETVLRGPLTEARLVEVLGQLRDLGIEPVSVDVDD